MGARNMRREVVPAHDSDSALSAHVSNRFFSIANIELGLPETKQKDTWNWIPPFSPNV